MLDSRRALARPGLPAADRPDPGTAVPLWHSLVGREQRPIGFRLQLHAPPGRTSLLAALDAALAGFVAEGANAFPHGMVVLAPHGAPLDDALLGWTSPRNVFLEIGQRELDDEGRVRMLFDAQRNGVRLVLRLEGGAAPARDRLGLFQFVLAAAGRPVPAAPPWLATGADDPPAAQAALKAGAHAVVGWPLVAPPQPRPLEPLQRTVMTAIRQVQADVDLPALERTFRSEPVLAYMLLTLANSPAFMRTQPVSSLTQAILVLGYARLVKWLVLLLVVASKDHSGLPAVYAAVVRGFCLEYLAAAAGADRQAQDEGFVLGAFSLMDVITGQRATDLFGQIALPEDLVRALVEQDGPQAPALALVRALEGGDPALLLAAAARCGVAVDTLNGIVLRALSSTDALQGVV